MQSLYIASDMSEYVDEQRVVFNNFLKKHLLPKYTEYVYVHMYCVRAYVLCTYVPEKNIFHRWGTASLRFS